MISAWQRWPGWALLWGLVLSEAVYAEVPRPAPLPIAQVLEMESDQLAATGEIRLRGEVTMTSILRRHFVIQEETAAIMVRTAEAEDCPEVGNWVEVSGALGEGPHHGYETRWIDATEVTSADPGASPWVVPTCIEDLATYRHWEHLVELEAVVLQTKVERGEMLLHLADTTGWLVALIRGWPPEHPPEYRPGSRLLLRGVNLGFNKHPSSALLAYWPSGLEVVSEGPPEPFGAELVDRAALRHRPPLPERVRLRAQVLHQRDGLIWLRDATGAFAADPLLPWSKVDADGWYPDAFVIPYLRPGEIVEVVGTPSSRQPAPHLMYARFRPTGEQLPLEPLNLALADVDLDRHRHDWIQVRGRVTSRSVNPSGNGRWRLSHTLTSQGREIEATVDFNENLPGSLAEIDDDVEVAGLLSAGPAGSLRLEVLRFEDLVSNGTDAGIARLRFWKLVGFVVLLLGLSGGWMLVLARRLRRAEAEAGETAIAAARTRAMNEILEQRVAERTTELQSAHADLRAALEQARELGVLKDRFVAMVSHEFRTPLGIIMSAVELLRHYADRLPADQRRDLFEDIFQSTLQMSGIMEQVLILGRVEAGRTGCRPVRLDLKTLCGRIVDECLSASHGKCRIRFDPTGDLVEANSDEALLRHILTNLLGNAAKYSPPGSEIELEVRRSDSKAVFVVRDHGIGIPADDLPRLFQAFQRGSNTTDFPGTGLGLVIVKRCVELHGGSIAVESEVEVGTTFTVCLPLFETAGAPALSAGSA